MAYGFIKVIAASSHVELSLSGTGGGTQYPSVKILNPNDGVVYVARNRDAPTNNHGDWDWKVPSQSYAVLPGPFTSAGLFYLDQSGAGHQGEITIYPSQQKVDDPMFIAIGRALISATTSMDVTEGAQPANPGAGILRLWGDGTDLLHGISSSGVDRSFIDSSRALGGVLSGTLPNPGMAAGAALANLAAHSIIQETDVAFGAAITTTSATFAVAESVSYTPAVAGSDLLVFYQGTFQNTLAGANNSWQLGIDGSGSGYPISHHAAGASYNMPILLIMHVPNISAIAHTLTVFWATNGGTLQQGQNREMFVIELKR